ncbi:MAG: hypothetical protein HKN97_06190, partial [Myxococcales bacterium]|nr:hypothetical protein [Myxococcales bacterium]
MAGIVAFAGSADGLQALQRHRSLRLLRRKRTQAPKRGFISTCRNASARTEVVELMTHNAKGEVIDAYTSWEWSTLCGELAKLEVDLNPAKLIVLPVAKNETPET